MDMITDRDARAVGEVCGLLREWSATRRIVRVKWLPKDGAGTIVATADEWVEHLRAELLRLVPEARRHSAIANDLPIGIATELGIRLIRQQFAFETRGMLGAKWRLWADLSEGDRDQLERQFRLAVARGLVELGSRLGLS